MLPFQGLTFCCTAIPLSNRQDIADMINKMGGVHYSDLMSDVKYLIVGDRNTEKYRYCVQNRCDVHFLKPGVIKECYDKWQADQSTRFDLDSLSMATFDGITVCLSRVGKFSDILGAPFRSSFNKELLKNDGIRKLIEDNGGKVTDSLSIANTCVVSTERTGKRYSKAVEWGISIVHPVWVVDSILRSATLDLNDYKLDSRLNGCNVWDEWLSHSRNRLKKNPKIWDEIMKTKIEGNDSTKRTEWDEPEDEETAVSPKKQGNRTIDNEASSLFQSLSFHTIGFNSKETAILKNIIGKNGGQLSNDASCLTHLIFPIALGPETSHLLKGLDNSFKERIKMGEILVVTEWFLERSIFYDKVMNDSWCFPFKGLKRSINKINVCISGFTGIELLHIEKLIAMLGFTFCPTLTSTRDLLIVNINVFRDTLGKESKMLFNYKSKDVIDCPTYHSGGTSVAQMSTRNKMNAAKNWNIPIVSIAYLFECLECSSSSPSQNLTLPDVTDSKWCVFAPRNLEKSKSLSEFIKSLSDGPKDKISSSSLQISPKKMNQKRNYGKLSGKASRESVTTKLRKVANDTGPENLSFEEDASTQVGYQDAESMQNNESLLRKLGDSISTDSTETNTR